MKNVLKKEYDLNWALKDFKRQKRVGFQKGPKMERQNRVHAEKGGSR